MNSDSGVLPLNLDEFIQSSEWTYAKTMPKWPHEYIVRGKVDERLFIQIVKYIRFHGYQGYFYKKKITYFEHDGMMYWTMGAPIDETTIINRCTKENTYEYRLKNGSLSD
jgi:hypothetical protein